jgi:signal transduction histidine kinase
MHDWLRRHPTAMDLVLCLTVAVLGQFFAPLYGPGHVLLGFALCGPLLLRRRFPAGVAAWCSLVGLAQLILGWRPNGYDFALVFAMYTVAAYGPRRAALCGPPIGVLAAVLAMARWRVPELSFESVVGGTLAAMSPLLIAWFVGDNVRTRRHRMAELEERAVRLEHERDTRAQIAAAEERARIARELHDVVAHNVSVMVVQSDGASAAFADGELPDVKAALEAIGRTGRTTLSELRLALGVLRDSPASYAPQPGLDELEGLVAQLRSAGRAVTVVTEGKPRALPSAVSLAAYRIVQEALTNVLKHAGPGADAEVRLAYDDDMLRIRIDDDGYGRAAYEEPGGTGLLGGGGHGLVGMRERAALFGGTVACGARPGGGFRVDTALPLRGAA